MGIVGVPRFTSLTASCDVNVRWQRNCVELKTLLREAGRAVESDNSEGAGRSLWDRVEIEREMSNPHYYSGSNQWPPQGLEEECPSSVGFASVFLA